MELRVIADGHRGAIVSWRGVVPWDFANLHPVWFTALSERLTVPQSYEKSTCFRSGERETSRKKRRRKNLRMKNKKMRIARRMKT